MGPDNAPYRALPRRSTAIILGLICCGGLFSARAIAADDVLVLKNGDKITGEIKKLEQGFVHIDADYGDNIFIIEWEKVERIDSKERFVIQTSAGDRLSGTVRTDPGETTRVLVEETVRSVPVGHMDVVTLRPVEEGFWGRFGASVDFGLSITKADETKQLNTRASASYLTEGWQLESSVNVLRNVRRDVPQTKRTEFGVTFRDFLTERWFYTAYGNFLQSDELELDLRSTVGGGVGRFMVLNNRWLFALIGGAVWTNEDFMDPAVETQNSGEAFGGVDLSIFNIGDFDVLSKFVVFPSLSQAGRVRMNFSTDFKWDLPKDLYFSVGFSNNFDSRPPTDVSKNDYIFNTSVGWSY